MDGRQADCSGCWPLSVFVAFPACSRCSLSPSTNSSASCRPIRPLFFPFLTASSQKLVQCPNQKPVSAPPRQSRWPALIFQGRCQSHSLRGLQMCCWRSRSPCHHWERHQVGARLGSVGTHRGWAPRAPAGQAGVTPSPLHCLPQPDLLHRERPRAAGARPGFQPQQAVLPGQLRGRLQGEILGHARCHGAREDPGGAFPLVATLRAARGGVWGLFH